MSARIPALVIGGSGYVAGEIVRLILGHPFLQLGALMSDGQAGSPIAAAFPHLASVLAGQRFVSREEMLSQSAQQGRQAIFSAAPHGSSAPLVRELLRRDDAPQLTVVDVSADFRFSTAAAYEAAYAKAHGAPELLSQFTCALPEHASGAARPHVSHPGCFATALLAALVPLLKLKISEDEFVAVGITGSTGSGRTPTPTTHHPERHGNLYAYQALHHRHTAEVVEICHALCGTRPRLAFVPQSGPFARGIYMTVQTRLLEPLDRQSLAAALADFYQGSSFMRVQADAPRLKNVTGSNQCHLGVEVRENRAVVFVALDNLVKGAAGGAVQWMNRKLGFPEETGLNTVALGWT